MSNLRRPLAWRQCILPIKLADELPLIDSLSLVTPNVKRIIRGKRTDPEVNAEVRGAPSLYTLQSWPVHEAEERLYASWRDCKAHATGWTTIHCHLHTAASDILCDYKIMTRR